MDKIRERQEEATSKETLKDLEDETSVDTEQTDEATGPSPDGAFDQEDELKDADAI